MSKGEEKVIELLQKGRYKFEREKRFTRRVRSSKRKRQT